MIKVTLSNEILKYIVKAIDFCPITDGVACP